MELIPWRPFDGELSSFRREIDRLWDRFLGESSFMGRLRAGWMPSTDVSETKDKVLIKAELPGLEGSDVDVSISGNVLTIKGEKKQEKEEKDEHRHYSERYYGSFQRSFQVPVNVEADKIDATFENGVLTVSMPKTEDAKKKEIQVKVK